MAAKRGEKWQARFRTPEKYHRPTFDTKEEAELWEKKARAAYATGRPIPDPKVFASDGGFTLKAFIDKFAEGIWHGKAYSEKTKQYCGHLVDFFGEDKLLADITAMNVHEWIDHLRVDHENSDSTINKKNSVFRTLLKKAKELEVIEGFPVIPHFKPGKGRTRFLSEVEEKTLLERLKWASSPEMYHRVIFMLDTGARDSDVRRLQWDHIDFKARKVTFWKTKNTKPRTLPLTSRALEALLCQQQTGAEKPFPISYSAFRENWQRILTILQWDDPSLVPYVLRHTCASKLVQRGVDLRRVKDWMGHKTIQTTMIYAHLATKDLDVCVDALEENAA